MLASDAFDTSGVEYYFECVSGPGNNSGWQTEPNYTDAGPDPNTWLDPNTEYCYRVMARDLSGRLNETVWSETVCVTTLVPPDTDPPIPNPMQWDPTYDANGYDGKPLEVPLQPDADNLHGWGATMTCVIAVDLLSPPVEYRFECVDNSGFSSGWQAANTWTVLIGRPGLTYSFRVKARDAEGNETGWSSAYPANQRGPDDPAVSGVIP